MAVVVVWAVLRVWAVIRYRRAANRYAAVSAMGDVNQIHISQPSHHT
ncbi:MAG: hypothetical protein HQ453_06035 [Actinobacteria bacterium]|nr:hypothetical protein [Actinomycetota bacterium]